MAYPWGDTRRFNSYAGYFRRLFGGRVQKLSVDAGFTCPNRDGVSAAAAARSATTGPSPPPTATRPKASGSRLTRGSPSIVGATAGHSATWSTFSPTPTPMRRLSVCRRSTARRCHTPTSRASSSGRAPTVWMTRRSTCSPRWPATGMWPSSTASNRPPMPRCGP